MSLVGGEVSLVAFAPDINKGTRQHVEFTPSPFWRDEFVFIEVKPKPSYLDQISTTRTLLLCSTLLLDPEREIPECPEMSAVMCEIGERASDAYHL